MRGDFLAGALLCPLSLLFTSSTAEATRSSYSGQRTKQLAHQGMSQKPAEARDSMQQYKGRFAQP